MKQKTFTLTPLASAIALASSQSFALCSVDDSHQVVNSLIAEEGTTFAEAVTTINSCNAESSTITIDETFANTLIENNQQMDFGPSALLVNSNSLVISGPDGKRPRLYISNSSSQSLFISESGQAELKNLELYGGNNEINRSGNTILHESGVLIIDNVKVGEFYHGESVGGVIRSSGNLTIKDSELSSNHSPNTGGAVYSTNGSISIENSVFASNDASNGGALYLSESDATIVESSFDNNQSLTNRGGAIYVFQGDLTIEDTVFEDNSTPNNNYAAGGAIYQTAESGSYALTVKDSEFHDNEAHTGGGAIHRQSSSGTVLIENSSFTQNRSRNWNGGSGDARGGAVYLDATTDTKVVGSTFQNNNSTHQGGALFITQYDADANVEISESTFDTNQVTSENVEASTTDAKGAALYIESDGTLSVSIEASTIKNNLAGTVTNEAGDLDNTGSGGAIYLDSSNPVSLTISDSTINHNKVGKDGAALYTEASQGIVVIENSTIAYNESQTTSESDKGATLFFTDVVQAGSKIAHSTIVNNTSNRYNAIKADGADFDVMEITHTIIANNSGISDSVCVTEANIGATINYSIIDSAGSACASGASDNSSIFSESTFDIENDLLLSDLADNGGSTQTFLPFAESPAVDAGDPNIETTPEYDQRGSTRISNGVIDIGAVEISSTSESNGSGPVHPIWLALMALLGLRRRK